MDFSTLYLLPLAFACELVDSGLGMGYGTILTPVLLLIGFEPLQIVPAVLASECMSGISAAVFHHRANNVDFSRTSKDTRVALVLSIFAVLGVVAAVVLAAKLPLLVLKVWIGGIILIMGVVILATLNRTPRFSWIKITALGTVASFNKGMSGGGYGPLVMGGQMLSGIGVKNAVGIASLSEGVTCLAGVVSYLVLRERVDWALAPPLMLGAVLSVPFAARILRKLPEKLAKIVVSTIIIFLGCLTLYKALVRG